MPTADDIARRYPTARRGSGGWRIPGACHGSHLTSLSVVVSDRDDGSLHVYCFAGCERPDVLAALGVETASRPAPRPAPRPKPATDAPLRAQRLIASCVADTHPYLERKGFPNARGLVTPDGLLAVPIRDAAGRLLSVQTIADDGAKRFLAGGQVKGGRLVLGRGREEWHCEGYATALTLLAAAKACHRQARVTIAFSAQNIPVVAKRGWIAPDRDPAICRACRHRHYPPAYSDRPICPECGADCIPPTGERYARRARLPLLLPPQPGDLNDWHVDKGLEAVVQAVRMRPIG